MAAPQVEKVTLASASELPAVFVHILNTAVGLT